MNDLFEQNPLYQPHDAAPKVAPVFEQPVYQSLGEAARETPVQAEAEVLSDQSEVAADFGLGQRIEQMRLYALGEAA